MTSCGTLLVVVLALSQSGALQIHERMSREDLRRTFQVDSHHQVPEYETVDVVTSSREKRSADGAREVHLSAFGRRVTLRLKPNQHFQEKMERFKVIEAETTPTGKVAFHEMKDNGTEGVAYHDETNMAAVVISDLDNGKFAIDGTIGNDLVVKPLPAALIEEPEVDYADDDEMFLDEDDFRDFKKNVSTKKPSHVVYKRKWGEEQEAHSDFLSMEPAVPRNATKRRSKRQAPGTVWPEVLLIVDYDTFILHNGNSHDIKRYFVSFWNGVDLRYKLLTQPTIKISLAGMIVAKDRDATPYLERNRLRAPNADAVDAAGALTDLGKYLYREDRLPTYDLAVVITKLDMCRRRFQGGRCNRGTAGFAYVGGACVVNKRLEKVNSVAIIEDSGGFSGIIVAAHEVGHLLGCVHDGSPPPSYLGGPGATRCPWEDGFIMSDLRHTERGFRWSSCSVEQFKHFLNGETATCLFNFPHENDLLARVLPGTMMTLDQQCKRDRGTTACFRDQRVCAQLFCFDSGSGYCVSYRPAAEGSPCGDGHVCKNGRCLTELENIIPDYTHVTATFADRPSGTDPFARRNDKEESSDDDAEDSPTKETPPTPKESPPPPRQRRPTTTPRPPKKKAVSSGSACRDTASKVGGSMTCREFLEQFGYRYCSHDYVKNNCCESHDAMCKKP